MKAKSSKNCCKPEEKEKGVNYTKHMLKLALVSPRELCVHTLQLQLQGRHMDNLKLAPTQTVISLKLVSVPHQSVYPLGEVTFKHLSAHQWIAT